MNHYEKQYFLKIKNMTVKNIPQNWWEIHNHTKMLEIVFSFVRSIRTRQKKFECIFSHYSKFTSINDRSSFSS